MMIKAPLPVGVRELRPNMSEDQLRELVAERLRYFEQQAALAEYDKGAEL